eukprot:CAMPEP_0198709640 /NCGR_PEP_ID=MMETSP1471-20131121/1947_1 /TAXON_ID=41880 /ORGANISM="Pycnococcus provasolii, Strain RCC733" /LENGTH=387 /DNA_ID=CAMNT_0044469065 /DNA_START=1 /DNA_END=1164 /DNA_ORIENTATION=-
MAEVERVVKLRHNGVCHCVSISLSTTTFAALLGIIREKFTVIHPRITHVDSDGDVCVVSDDASLAIALREASGRLTLDVTTISSPTTPKKKEVGTTTPTTTPTKRSSGVDDGGGGDALGAGAGADAAATPSPAKRLRSVVVIDDDDDGATTTTAQKRVSWGPILKSHRVKPLTSCDASDIAQRNRAEHKDTWLWHLIGVMNITDAGDGMMLEMSGASKVQAGYDGGTQFGWKTTKSENVATNKQRHVAAWAAGVQTPTGLVGKGVPVGFRHEWQYGNADGIPPMRVGGGRSVLTSFHWDEVKTEREWVVSWRARCERGVFAPGRYLVVLDQRAERIKTGAHPWYNTEAVGTLVACTSDADARRILSSLGPNPSRGVPNHTQYGKTTI